MYLLKILFVKRLSCSLPLYSLIKYVIYSSSLSTLVLQDLLLIWPVLMSSQRAKQLLSTDWWNIYISPLCQSIYSFMISHTLGHMMYVYHNHASLTKLCGDSCTWWHDFSLITVNMSSFNVYMFCLHCLCSHIYFCCSHHK